MNGQKLKVCLMVDAYLKPRTIKIGRSLKRNDVQVAIIADKNTKEQIKRTKKFYDELFFFDKSDGNALRHICKKAGADIFHIVSEAHISEWIESLINDKGEIGTIIFDQYDHYRGFVSEEWDVFAKREKRCLEESDGICKRNFEADYLKEAYGYKPKKEIQFFDYCWGDYADKNHYGAPDDSKLKIVYGGRLLPLDVSMQDYYANLYKVERAGYTYVARIMEEYGGSFTIIPSVDIGGRMYSGYRNLPRMFPSTVIEHPMNTEDLIRFEGEMDYGIDCVDLKQIVGKYAGHMPGFIKEHTYYATNKFFDYLDAGIMPIYGRDYELFGRHLEKAGAAYYCSLDDMKDRLDYLKENRGRMKNQVMEARELFSVDKQIKRLIAFYKECIGR